MEEDYEVRESNAQVIDVSQGIPARGGSGGVGAMNPGAVGRDHPEVTARLDDADEGQTIDTEQRTSDEPPSSEYAFEIPLFADSDHPESLVQSVEGESWAPRPRSETTSLLLLSGVALSMVSWAL